MPTLQITLLGSFQVSLDEQPVTAFESDKVRALLAFLAVEVDQSHRREVLAALLWPNMPETVARSNLRHALANLRRVIDDYNADPPYLHITRQTIQFNRQSRHFLDLAPFQLPPLTNQQTNQLPTAKLETMAALYRGDFLAGFSITGSTTFDEWTAVKREQYHQRMRQVLHDLADAYAQRGQYEPALAFAQRQVTMEPWDEAAHQQLIRFLALADQRPSALAQYETCCRILEEELGIPPTGTTTTLYENIRDETWPDAAARLSLPRFVVEETVTPPLSLFVARENELTQLNQLLNQAYTHQNQIAFITGEAGSGKTALMHAFARQAMAAQPDLLVASGKCSAYTGSGDPYLPFLEITQMLTGDIESHWEAGDISTDHARRLWSTLPVVTEALVNNGRLLLNRFIASTDLLARAQVRTRHKSSEHVPWLLQLAKWVEAGKTAALSGVETAVLTPQTDLFAQFAKILQTIAGQYPLLLLLDDFQWVDSGSLNLLFHLGQHLHGSGIFILAAYRPEDVAQGQNGQPHPVARIVNELQQIYGPNQVDLRGAGGRPFIDALLDSQPNKLDETFRQMLYQQTDGHALFTIELLRGLQERGDLIQDDIGRWITNGNLNWDISPARVEAIIAGRINRLPPSCRTTLTIASVEGEAFTAEVVAYIQKVNADETVRCLSGDLSRQHRLVTAQSRQHLGQQHLSRYRFHHFLFQKYLYNDLDPVERANLHEDIGDALEQLYGPQETALAALFGQLAWHYQEAGALEKAIHYCQKAGERAWQLSASTEAISHLQQGIALLKTLPDSPEHKQQELMLQMSLVMPMQAAKGFAAPEFRSTCDRAYLLTQQVGQTPQLIVILSALGSYYLSSGQYRTSLNLAQQKLELAQCFHDDLQIALARLGLAANCIQLGKFIQCRQHTKKMLDFYDHRQHHALAGDHTLDPGVNSLIWAALAAWILGYPDQAKQHSQEAIDWSHILEHPISLTAALEISGGILHILRREYQAAAEKLEASMQLAAEQKFGLFLSEGLFYQGYLQVKKGQFDDGIVQMQQALTNWRATGMRIMYSQMLGLLAEALGLAGQVEAGLQTLDEAFTEVCEREERFFKAELYRIKGDLLQKCTSKLHEAESNYQQAITIAHQQAAKSWELRVTLSLARLWQTQGKSSQARALLTPIYNWFVEGFDTPDLVEAKTLLDTLPAR